MLFLVVESQTETQLLKKENQNRSQQLCKFRAKNPAEAKTKMVGLQTEAIAYQLIQGQL